MAYGPSKTCYIVAFEVGASRLTQFQARLKAYGSYCPINAHCWAILAQQTAVQVRDYLTEALAPDDRIFVIRSGTEAAWRNAYGEKNNEWLKSHL